jgi:hypothetical protein
MGLRSMVSSHSSGMRICCQTPGSQTPSPTVKPPYGVVTQRSPGTVWMNPVRWKSTTCTRPSGSMAG